MIKKLKFRTNAGADLGFPIGGGTNPPGERRAPTYNFAKFSKKTA